MATVPDPLARPRARLELLYGPRAGEALGKLRRLLDEYRPRLAARSVRRAWDQRDAVLITYGDQVRAAGEPPLATLGRFLLDHGLDERLSGVHLLPFFPYSSDDGFSIIDYRRVDPALGDWSDVEALGARFELMFDLVLNHCSRQSAWFQNYLAGREPGLRYFIEVDPAADLSRVVRPRNLPLLTPVETSRGERQVWTTFSADQVDLNYAEPDVLIEMLDIFLSYLARGARIVRLDAIAYLWKQLGTSCIHLPQTHAVVKLLRDVADLLAPGARILTETNVPHRENVAYFGQGDEAHMVYQFSLAPLLLDALLTGDARPLASWLANLAPAPPGATYFNFTASHDGVGARPLEGLLPPERIERLLEAVRLRGGRVSYKRDSDGGESPYELNITYYSALAPLDAPDGDAHVRAFLASQAIALALRGVPGVYFHSLVGTPNDQAGVEASGQARRINRRKFEWDELQAILTDEQSPPVRVFAGYKRLLDARRGHPAFHPDGDQQVWDVDDSAVLALLRSSPDRARHVLMLANVGRLPRRIDLRQYPNWRFGADLLQADAPRKNGKITLAPYQVAWLEASETI